jgi:hypothetical protein
LTRNGTRPGLAGYPDDENMADITKGAGKLFKGAIETTKDVGGRAVDVTKDVGHKAVDVSKPVAGKAVDVTSDVGHKAVDVTKDTGKGLKRKLF